MRVAAVFVGRHHILASWASHAPNDLSGVSGSSARDSADWISDIFDNCRTFPISPKTQDTVFDEVVAYLTENNTESPERICIASYDHRDTHELKAEGAVAAPHLKDIRGFRTLLGLPGAIEVKDVAACAVGEAYLRRELSGDKTYPATLVYLIFGYGIGAGLSFDGKLWNPATHPEISHLRIPVHPSDAYTVASGNDRACWQHSDCLMNLGSLRAINLHQGRKISAFMPVLSDEEAEKQAFYMAHVCATLNYVLRPNYIILGGEISTTPGILQRVHDALYADSLQANYDGAKVELALTMPSSDPGLIGAMIIAARNDAHNAAP